MSSANCDKRVLVRFQNKKTIEGLTRIAKLQKCSRNDLIVIICAMFVDEWYGRNVAGSIKRVEEAVAKAITKEFKKLE